MIDFKFLVEHDPNPLIIYNDKGKITYLNMSAELLLGACDSKEFYQLALTYAPKTFGANTTYIDLIYKSFKFYAISVLYESEDELAIHLYNKPVLSQKELTLEGFTSTDINLLLQAHVELFRSKYTQKLSLLTDYDLPKIELHQNNISILFRKLFELCLDATNVEISLRLKIGETVKINKEKYPILLFRIKTDKRDESQDAEIATLAAKNHINHFLESHNLLLEIPLISQKP